MKTQTRRFPDTAAGGRQCDAWIKRIEAKGFVPAPVSMIRVGNVADDPSKVLSTAIWEYRFERL